MIRALGNRDAPVTPGGVKVDLPIFLFRRGFSAED